MPSHPTRLCQTTGCRAVVTGIYCLACQRLRATIAGSGLDHTRPCPAQRGYNYRWRTTRIQYLARFPWCVHCGRPATQVDHVIPLRVGGANHESNYQSLCQSCHSRKTAREQQRRIPRS